MYIVADVGGTKTRVAGSRDLESFNEPNVFETPQPYEAWREKFIEVARSLAKDESIERICFGVAGAIEKGQRQTLITSPHLRSWVGINVCAPIELALGTTIHLENDTALCGLGEGVQGAGRGAKTFIYYTVSTGVGGVRIRDQRIDIPLCSAEAGQQYLIIEGQLRALQDVVSGSNIEQRFGMRPRDLGKEHPVWEELARYMAIGVHNSILHWTPDRVVLGGSMFNEIGIPVDRVQFHLKEIMRAFPTIPEIVHSQLGDTGGLWGGIARLKQLQS